MTKKLISDAEEIEWEAGQLTVMLMHEIPEIVFTGAWMCGGSWMSGGGLT